MGGGFGFGGFGMMGPHHRGPPPPPHHDGPPQARFVRDGSHADGASVEKDSEFTKVWVVRNDGGAEWPAGSCLKFVSGDEMAIELPVGLSARPGEEVTVSCILKTPPLTGRFVSYFRLAGPAGNFFGQRLWCDVRSVDSAEGPASPSPPAEPAAQPAVQPAAEQQPFARELALLRELGFTNVDQLLPLLRDLVGSSGAHNVEALQRVIATLVAATSASH